MALKYGAPVEEVARHLSGHFDQSGGFVEGQGFVNSRWELVAEALRSDTPQEKPPILNRCPECGEGTLVRQGGCTQCDTCAYSACG